MGSSEPIPLPSGANDRIVVDTVARAPTDPLRFPTQRLPVTCELRRDRSMHPSMQRPRRPPSLPRNAPTDDGYVTLYEGADAVPMIFRNGGPA